MNVLLYIKCVISSDLYNGLFDKYKLIRSIYE